MFYTHFLSRYPSKSASAFQSSPSNPLSSILAAPRSHFGLGGLKDEGEEGLLPPVVVIDVPMDRCG